MSLIQLTAQLAISIAAAFLAAHLAVRRFKTERWWERKLNAYTDLIDALSLVKWDASERYEAALGQRELNDEYSDEISAGQLAARKKAWQIAETSSFLISDQVLDAMQKMERGLSESRAAKCWQEHLETREYAADICIKEIKAIGAKELGFRKT